MLVSVSLFGTIVRMGQKSLEADALSIAIACILDRSKDEQGISFRELEERSGVSRARTQRCMKGERPFMIDDVEAIASALGLKASAVVREAEDSLALSIVSEPAVNMGQDDYAPAAHNPGVDIEAEQEGMMEES